MFKDNYEWKILNEFFEDPDKSFYIRELSRKTKINPVSVKQHLDKLVRKGLIVKLEKEIYPKYKVVISQEFIDLKRFYNITKLRESGLIVNIKERYDFPTIVLFGSYSKGEDNKESDIDLFVLTDIKGNVKGEEFEKKLNRKISIHTYSKKEFEELKKKNKELVNSIVNGIVLSGQLEVL